MYLPYIVFVYSLPFALLLQLSPYSHWVGRRRTNYKRILEEFFFFFFFLKCLVLFIFVVITYLLACFHGYDNINLDGLLGGFEKALFG